VPKTALPGLLQLMKMIKNKLLPVLFILCMGILPAWSQSGKTWPIFRGDAQLSGISNARIQLPLKLKWTYLADDGIAGAPIIADGKIFVGSIGGTMYALNMKGEPVWSYEMDNSIEAPALYHNGQVVIGDLSGFLYSLEAKTGTLTWKYETENQIMGSPNYFSQGGKSYFVVGSYDYFLHCVKAESGEVSWKYEADNFVNGSSAIGNGMAMFGGCDGLLHLVDVSDGTSKSRIEVATYVAGSVAIRDGLAYTGDYDGKFSCIDLNKKEIKWSWKNPKSNLPILGSPSITGDKVVIGGQDKFMYCFNRYNGTMHWSFNAGGRVDASPVIARDKVIAATMDGMLYVLDLNNGGELWSYEIGSGISHNPAVINGYLVLGARDGNIYCFGN